MQSVHIAIPKKNQINYRVHYWGIAYILVTFIAFSMDTITVVMFVDATMYLTKSKSHAVTVSIWQSTDIYVYNPGALILSKRTFKQIEFVWIVAADTPNCTYLNFIKWKSIYFGIKSLNWIHFFLFDWCGCMCGLLHF